MLATHIEKREVIDRDSIWAVLKGLVDYRVVQVPGHIRSGSSYWAEESLN